MATSRTSTRNGRRSVLIQEEVRIPADVFDLDGFRRWAHSKEFPQRGRFSFLAGEVDVDMSPEEIETHNKVKTAVVVGLGTWLNDRDLGELLTDGVLYVNEEAKVSTEPDVAYCSWDTLRKGLARYAEVQEGSNRLVELVGAPDCIVEIVSRYSVRKDKTELAKLYFNAGVREYWLIDARGAAIDFRLHVRGKQRFTAVQPDSQDFRRSEVLGGRFKLVRDRNPVGGYRYALLAR